METNLLCTLMGGMQIWEIKCFRFLPRARNMGTNLLRILMRGMQIWEIKCFRFLVLANTWGPIVFAPPRAGCKFGKSSVSFFFGVSQKHGDQSSLHPHARDAN
jgi:hypothetical protein